jgi:hypothetical protein
MLIAKAKKKEEGQGQNPVGPGSVSVRFRPPAPTKSGIYANGLPIWEAFFFLIVLKL